MDPFTDRIPDARLMARLAIQVRFGDRIGAFMAGGDALALAVLASAGGPLPGWAHDLADSMVGALLLVEDATIDDASPAERVRLASAALVLSTIRPRASCATDGALSLWMNWGMGTPRCCEDPALLRRWTLLRLFLDDADGAVEAVHTLADREPSGVNLALLDWVVARVHGHGPARERAAFGHLRTLLAADGVPDPVLVVLGAVALNQAGPMRRDAVLGWLDARVAPDSATPAPAARVG